MTDILSRMEYEPEAFNLVDGRFLQAQGKTVLVLPINTRRWSIVIHGGVFKYGGDIAGYHKLTWLENRRAIRAMRKVRAA